MPTELIWKSQQYSVDDHLKGFMEEAFLRITNIGSAFGRDFGRD